MKHLLPLLLLVPTLALTAAEGVPGVAVWDAGAGTVGAEAAARGLGVRPGTVIAAGAEGPARLVLPGTASGLVTLAAGSTVTLTERRIEAAGTTTAELIVTVTAGAVTVTGDLAPRYAALRLRGAASETVAAPGVGVALEAGDTVVALDGPVRTGPLPGTANGWQALAERVELAPRQAVLVDPRTGVGEPFAAPGRPQLAGPAAGRPSLRTQTTATEARERLGAEAWSADAAGRELGPADPAWWTLRPAAPAAPAARSWSLLVQLSGFSDSNPNGVAEDLGGGTADRAWSAYGDARWTCLTAGDYALRLQAVGGQVRYRGFVATDDAGIDHASRDKDQRQLGLSAAVVAAGGGLEWSVGGGGVRVDEAGQDRRVVRLTGDLGRPLGESAYAVLNLGWAHSTVTPTGPAEDHTVRTLTARPAWTMAWPGDDWTPSLEVSLLLTDSRSADPVDDFAALRPGVAWLNRVGSLDLGLAARREAIAYREARSPAETTLARERVAQLTASADWWMTPGWSAGLFGNRLWFTSNQDLSDYTQTQVGVRTTVRW